MKKNLLFILIVCLTFNAFSQKGYIKISSDLEEETSWVMVYLNDESQDAMHSDIVEIEDLYSGKYNLRVSFNSDTIADWVKVIKLKRNEQIEFKVIKMKDFGKDVGKVGRGVGNMTGKTGENDAEDLVQYYRLEKVKKK